MSDYNQSTLLKADGAKDKRQNKVRGTPAVNPYTQSILIATLKPSCDQWPSPSKRGRDPVEPFRSSQIPAVFEIGNLVWTCEQHTSNHKWLADMCMTSGERHAEAEWSATDYRVTGDWSEGDVASNDIQRSSCS